MFSIKHTVAATAIGLMGLSTAAQAVSLADLKQDGPYQIVSEKLTDTTGFGGGTIHAPKEPGQYALIAVCPGFVSPESSITKISERLATHGFVVVTIATNTIFDLPASRASQILAALKAGAAVKTGNAAGKMDVSRMVASGWSMGGGGAMEASTKTPKLKATVAYAPWDLSPTIFKALTVPTIIFGATGDIIAPNKTHSIKFYGIIPNTTKKTLAILQGSSHFFPLSAIEPVSYSNIAWNKRFADGNAEYSQFLTDQGGWSSYETNGPF